MSERRTRRASEITLAHGGGGQLTDELVAEMILPRFENATLNDLLDSAVIGKTALTIDSYVVQPLFFPGGDIGRLAVCGTVNDLAVCGATPVGIALSLIIAEGLEKPVLGCVLDSIAHAAREASVKIVTGDTKVVGRNQADGLYITTAGVGLVESQIRLHPDQVRPGDRIILTGHIADHGLAVMLAREMPDVSSALRSDVAPLSTMLLELAKEVSGVRFMRDPTRGGLAAVAADLANAGGFNVVLEETAIPIRPETLQAAELLGLDPLEVANEGKAVVVVEPEHAGEALRLLRAHEHGAHAAIIGEISAAREGLCELITEIGGRRILQKPYGEQLPRIC
jgi:hydrogenase expression/formation protein HypE